MRYLIVAEADRDLEQLSSRLALTARRVALLLADTQADLLPTLCCLCLGLIAPELAGPPAGAAGRAADSFARICWIC